MTPTVQEKDKYIKFNFDAYPSYFQVEDLPP